MKPNRIKAVLFDVDGVLLDSFQSNLSFFRNLFKFAGYKKLPTTKTFRQAFYLTMADVIKLFTNSENKKELKRIWKIAYRPDAQRFRTVPVKLMPYSNAILKKLSKNYKLAVVSSRTIMGMNAYYDVSGLKNIFDAEARYEHTKKHKPDPAPLRLVCRKLGIKPSQAVYVGDAIVDVMAAQAIGMPTVVYNKIKIPGADFQVDDLRKLPAVIKKISQLTK